MKDSLKSVDVAKVEVEKVSGVDVEKVSVVEVDVISGVEVGICSLFVLSEKRTGDIFAIAKLEALISSSVLLNWLST